MDSPAKLRKNVLPIEGNVYKFKGRHIYITSGGNGYVDGRYSGYWGYRYVKEDGTLGREYGGYIGGACEEVKAKVEILVKFPRKKTKLEQIIDLARRVLDLEKEEERLRKEYPVGSCNAEDAWWDFAKYERKIKSQLRELVK